MSEKELESMLNAMDEKREKVTQAGARRRLLSALRSQAKTAPPKLQNGNRFLNWKTEVNLSNSRLAGPAVCLGKIAELCWDWRADIHL